MESMNWVCRFLLLLLVFSVSSSSSYAADYSSLHPLAISSFFLHQNFTAISEFRVLNRKKLDNCSDSYPGLKINVSSNPRLSDEEFVTVTVTGVSSPSDKDWVAMISPSHSNVNSCLTKEFYYLQTGDTAALPLLCHYPVKAQYMKNDPNYLNCKSKNGSTCSGTLKFHVINIRTDIQFVLFSGGFVNPCILARSEPISFANPNKPLHGHISSIDSTGTSMRLTWVSGDKKPQQIQYDNNKRVTSSVTTFTQDDMCRSTLLNSPAKDFGWHDPGYIHSAVMTGLKPSTIFSYRYGSDSVGWSEQVQFAPPPVGGSDELRFIAFGDMGKTPLDASTEHYIQPGALSVIKAVSKDVDSKNVDSVFHIGDISYATGFLVEWDYFLNLIKPVASRVSYMTAIGNHERDYDQSGSVYITPDSGGECGVPYEAYFPMPTAGKDKPWYSIEQAGVHFTVISTENDWSQNSEQYQWMKKDMASVNRQSTPWLIFMGHRPMYTSINGLLFSADSKFVKAVEPLLRQNKVDLVLFGHVHNYERTCSIYNKQCTAMPTKDRNGIDTYDHRNYSAPVHVVIGMGGFTLDPFPNKVDKWSLVRISNYGYLRAHATKEEINLEFVNSGTGAVEDSFRITRCKLSSEEYRDESQNR